MFDILQTSSIAGFVAGVFFVLGMGLCLLKGELVEETLAMASSSFGPDSTTECLLKIHDDVERQSILDPANEVTVELTTSYHFH